MIFAGYTEGDWGVNNVGGNDFAAVGALASFSGTPTIASPDEESSSEPFVLTNILTPLLITLSVFAVFGWLAYRTTKRSSGSGAENGGDSMCQQDARESGVVPYTHAVAVPATSDTDGSGRAWTVVAAQVVG